MAEIDNYDLRATLRSIYGGGLTADEAKAVLDITRRAAAADRKTDIAEMTMLLRVKDLLAQMADVVQRTARRRAHEHLDIGVEMDERFGQVRAHEAVRSGDEARASGEELAELAPQVCERFVRPGGVVSV